MRACLRVCMCTCAYRVHEKGRRKGEECEGMHVRASQKKERGESDGENERKEEREGGGGKTSKM